MLGNRARCLADLVDDAPGRAASEQHGGRSAQYLDSFIVKCVAVVLGNIAYPVKVDVTCDAESAQADVVANAATFSSLKTDSNNVFQRAFKAVLALVMNQFFVHNSQRLGNIFGCNGNLANAGDSTLVGLCLTVTGGRDSYRRQGFTFNARGRYYILLSPA